MEKELLELVMEIKKVKKARKKRQDYEKKNGFLIPPHSLNNFEVKNTVNMKIDLRLIILEAIYPNAVPLK